MPVRTPIFAAHDAELTPEVLEHGPTPAMPTVDGVDIQPPFFVRLIQAAAYCDAMTAWDAMNASLPRVRTSGPAGQTLLIPLPDLLRNSLAAASPERLTQARAEALGGARHLDAWFDDLVKLSRDAVRSGHSLWMWTRP